MINHPIAENSFKNGILFEAGESSRNLLVITFKGMGPGMLKNPDKFLKVAGLRNCHCISLQEPHRLWYQSGINDQVTDFAQVCEYLKGKIEELKVETVVVIGTSSGGHAAFLAAHYLKVDYAHVFGPQTSIGFRSLKEKSFQSFGKRLKTTLKLYRRSWKNWRTYDLRSALREHNGKTKYFVHFARDNQYDPERARNLENVPGVKLFAYPYGNHAIIGPLRKDGYLRKLFRPRNIGDPQRLFDRYYAGDPDETKNQFQAGSPQQRVAEVIQSVAATNPDLESIYNAADLASELALDSVSSLEIVIELENIFSVNIDMGSLEDEDMKTVTSLLKLVERSTSR